MNSDLIDQFIDFYWLTTGASINTLSAYRSDLKIFSKWLNNNSLIDVDKKQIQDYFSYRKDSNI
ncbi:site-specific integrase, partial [Candidatus Thioglobus sp.]|nr:site-specific integrase [Candidatus Thioglobus sp.]